MTAQQRRGPSEPAEGDAALVRTLVSSVDPQRPVLCRCTICASASLTLLLLLLLLLVLSTSAGAQVISWSSNASTS